MGSRSVTYRAVQFSGATSTSTSPGTLHEVTAIPIPGQALKSFDISAFSDAQGVYGFSDRSNRSVDLIDAATDRFAGRVEGFTHGGPNGLVAVGNGQFWAGDADSKLRVVDIRSRKIVATIDTGGKQRVDELAWDPRNRVVVAVNNADQPPFVSFVSTAPGHHIVGKLSLPQATDGLEQPLWNPADGLIYLSVPVLDHHKADGGIAVIDPARHRLVEMIHVSQCMPAGLALGPGDHLLVGCSDDAVAAGFAPRSLIVDLHARKVVKTIRQVGGSDEVWYDAGAGRYYLAAVANTHGPVLGVIDARNDAWLKNLPTGGDAHSVAADPHNGRVFVPITANDTIKGCSNGCVEVFGGK
ncbi:MAG: cytochrome C nitrite reductase [Rhodanobacteraceae bacterium]|nr:MAG: cytochrome C nitrite reductase [Rhodanobacteraceae bacterium]